MNPSDPSSSPSTSPVDPTQTPNYAKRIQLGSGTTFLPGPIHPSITTHITSLLSNGYTILPSIFTPQEVSNALSELHRLESLPTTSCTASSAAAGPASHGGRNPFEGFKTRRIYALSDKSRAFDCFAIQEDIMRICDFFLEKEFLLTSFHTVNILPGAEVQGLHTDDGLVGLPRPRPLLGLGAMVSLDAFTPTNGATLVIPGSHLWPDSRLPFRSETIPVVMPAGSMAIFLNTLWHSGGANTSSSPRRSLTVQYAQPWMRTFEAMAVAAPWEDLDALPKRLLRLMGFSTHGFMGYVDGRAPRTGVEERKRRLVESGVQKEREREEREKREGKSKL